MSTRRQPRQPRSYSDEDKRAALTLAASIGTRAASRELDMSLALFHKWKHQMPEFWSDLLAKRSPDEFQQGFAAKLDDIADTYAEVEVEAIERAIKLIPRADGKELAALMRSLATGRATAVTSAKHVRGEPDQTSELNINFPQLEQAMEHLLNGAAPAPQLPTRVQNEAEDGR